VRAYFQDFIVVATCSNELAYN